jgi:parvulin-like peptidyl-prolyl isomerase
MKKIIVAAGALAVVLAACSSSNEVVASVNGTDITRAEVESLVGNSEGGFTNTEFATYLSVAIQWEATDQAVADQFDVEITEEQIDERVDQLVFEFNPGAQLDDYLETINASEEGIRRFAYQLILQDFILEELNADLAPITDEDVAKELADFPLDWTQVCASHILVASEEEAVAVQGRLDAGEDFAALATELSLDTGSGANGGDLGCAAPSGYVGPFADAAVSAEIGVVTDPVETEFGYHLILVSDRIEADEDLVRQYLEQNQASTAVDEWFLGVIEAADVTVEESVGEWTTDPTPQVVAAL